MKNLLDKTIMMGKMQGKRKAGRQRVSSTEEVESSTQVNLVKLSKATRNRNAWRALTEPYLFYSIQPACSPSFYDNT
jgi:hypothetical protein